MTRGQYYMQISSGWAKGMRLKTPTGAATTRPTSAKVRAASLNALAPALEGALFLDLFAGSGAVGIEAVSRGARGAVFVDHGKEPLRCLKENLDEVRRRAEKQGIDAGLLDVLATSAETALARLKGREPFDVVFVDPPYREAAEWARRLLPELAELTTPDALVAFESDTAQGGEVEAAGAAHWQVVRQKSYGDTMVTIFGRME